MRMAGSNCTNTDGCSDVGICRLEWLVKSAHDFASRLGSRTKRVNHTQTFGHPSGLSDTHAISTFNVKTQPIATTSESICDLFGMVPMPASRLVIRTSIKM